MLGEHLDLGPGRVQLPTGDIGGVLYFGIHMADRMNFQVGTLSKRLSTANRAYRYVRLSFTWAVDRSDMLISYLAA